MSVHRAVQDQSAEALPSRKTNMGRAARKRVYKSILFGLQRGRCALCQREMLEPSVFYADGSTEDPAAPTLDHVHPLSRGGPNTLKNMLLAHKRCNADRANGDPPPHALEIARQIRAAVEAIMAAGDPARRQGEAA